MIFITDTRPPLEQHNLRKSPHRSTVPAPQLGIAPSKVVAHGVRSMYSRAPTPQRFTRLRTYQTSFAWPTTFTVGIQYCPGWFGSRSGQRQHVNFRRAQIVSFYFERGVCAESSRRGHGSMNVESDSGFVSKPSIEGYLPCRER